MMAYYYMILFIWQATMDNQRKNPLFKHYGWLPCVKCKINSVILMVLFFFCVVVVLFFMPLVPVEWKGAELLS